MSLRSIVDWAPVIQGTGHERAGRPPYRALPEDLQRWYDLFAHSTSALSTIGDTESYKQFYKVEHEIAQLVPKAEQQEAFYSLKNKMVVPDVPAALIFFLRKIWDKYHIYNLLISGLPTFIQRDIVSSGYLGSGYTLIDVVCNFCGKNFNVLSEERMLVTCGDWYEMYIPATDMVAAIPTELGERLKSEDMYDLSLTPGVGLTLRGQPLYQLQGVKDSFYDLR